MFRSRATRKRPTGKSNWPSSIGTGGSYIEEADAMSHVAGFTVVNDLSEREFQIERSGTWDKGKGCGHLRADRSVAGDARRGRRLRQPQDVARRRWRAHAGRLDQNDGLQGAVSDCLSIPVHEPAARRCHLHWHAARRRHGHEGRSASSRVARPCVSASRDLASRPRRCWRRRARG